MQVQMRNLEHCNQRQDKGTATFNFSEDDDLALEQKVTPVKAETYAPSFALATPESKIADETARGRVSLNIYIIIRKDDTFS